MASNEGRSNRGFGSMDEEKQREIASKGGKEAHRQGTAHEFDSEEARESGKKEGRDLKAEIAPRAAVALKTGIEANLDEIGPRKVAGKHKGF